MKTVKVIVLFGDGINCERETSLAFRELGADVQIVHINDLLKKPVLLKEFDIMAIPGGFSFGDELGSGRLLALKIKHGLLDEFKNFVESKKPIIGICNGFQVLVQLGLFSKSDENLTLTYNESGNFINKWVDLEVEENTRCKWIDNSFKGETFRLPIRHGEGNFNTNNDQKKECLENLKLSGNIVLRYKENINGSMGNIAGICDDSGLVFGLMPHPEAAFFKATSEKISKNILDKGVGVNFFGPIIKLVGEECHE